MVVLATWFVVYAPRRCKLCGCEEEWHSSVYALNWPVHYGNLWQCVNCQECRLTDRENEKALHRILKVTQQPPILGYDLIPTMDHQIKIQAEINLRYIRRTMTYPTGNPAYILRRAYRRYSRHQAGRSQ